ncbi:unnamed protein product [Pleuronectes platessa]|uniref:Uncharacterized protein n=1 Tax=Pleuronectes platessa TaxID=8262 RepID=A0A9N7U902_PLEPL|nr:unnamed protein product [Pleuronectes platessa]
MALDERASASRAPPARVEGCCCYASSSSHCSHCSHCGAALGSRGSRSQAHRGQCDPPRRARLGVICSSRVYMIDAHHSSIAHRCGESDTDFDKTLLLERYDNIKQKLCRKKLKAADSIPLRLTLGQGLQPTVPVADVFIERTGRLEVVQRVQPMEQPLLRLTCFECPAPLTPGEPGCESPSSPAQPRSGSSGSSGNLSIAS